MSNSREKEFKSNLGVIKQSAGSALDLPECLKPFIVGPIKKNLLDNPSLSFTTVMKSLLREAADGKPGFLQAWVDASFERKVDWVVFPIHPIQTIMTHNLSKLPKNLQIILGQNNPEKHPQIKAGFKNLLNHSFDIILQLYEGENQSTSYDSVLPMTYPLEEGGLVGFLIKLNRADLALEAIKKGHPIDSLKLSMSSLSYLMTYPNQRKYLTHLVKIFSDKKIPWNIDSSSETFEEVKNRLLRMALLNESTDLFEALIDAGAPLNPVLGVSSKINSLLHVTTTQGNLQTTKYLLSKGVDVKAIEDGGNALVPLLLYHSNPNFLDKSLCILDLLEKAGLDIEEGIKVAENTEFQRNYVLDFISKIRSIRDKKQLKEHLPQSQGMGLNRRI